MFYPYDLSTGLFTGTAFDVQPFDQAKADAMVPAGCALREGPVDPIGQRMDVAATPHALVDYQPPKPSDGALATYAWDAATRRWIASPTTLALREEAKSSIDQLAGEARRRFITDVSGQEGVYLQKREQAMSFVAAGGAGTVPPYVAAESVATGVTPIAAAQAICSIAALWNDTLSPAIEQIRIAQKRAADAASGSDISAAVATAATQFAAVGT